MTVWHPSRREFLRTGSQACAWLGISLPALATAACDAREQPATSDLLIHLDEEQARTLGALVDVILPRTSTPGASDLGTVAFVDRVLDSLLESSIPFIHDGLATTDTLAREAGGASLSELDEPEQIQVAQRLESEQGGFFSFVRYLTCYGVFGHPKWGGNRNMDGWRLAGMDPQPTYEPPFGYYDRDAHGGGA